VFQYEVLELALIIPITGTVIACLQRCSMTLPVSLRKRIWHGKCNGL